MNEVTVVILGAILNSVAVIFVGIMSIYNANKIKDIENEKEAMKLYVELSGNEAFNSIIKTIDGIDKGDYTYRLEQYRKLMSVNREVRNKLRAMCEKRLNKGK